MNLKWLVAIGLILILVIAPVSAAYHVRNVSLGRGGDRMGWLYTPDFRNGGFETGDLSYWGVYNYNPSVECYVVWDGDQQGRVGAIGIVQSWVAGITQNVNLRGATGMSFLTKCNGVDDYNPAASYIKIKVDIDGTNVYEREVTSVTTWNWTEETVTGLAYTGRETATVIVETYGCGAVVYIDDIHLTGPGF